MSDWSVGVRELTAGSPLELLYSHLLEGNGRSTQQIGASSGAIDACAVPFIYSRSLEGSISENDSQNPDGVTYSRYSREGVCVHVERFCFLEFPKSLSNVLLLHQRPRFVRLT